MTKCKSDKHKKTPARAGDGVLDDINLSRKNVMIDISTKATNVIPFTFGKQQVRTLLIDDQLWFVAKDVIASLEYAKSSNPARVVDHVPAQWRGVNQIHTLGGDQQLLTLSEQGLYFFIGRSDKPKALPFQMWLAGEVLPSIRKTGAYADASNKISTLLDELIGMSELNVLKGLIRDKAKAVAPDLRQGFQLVMHNRLHTRFNVPRTEMIPASQFDQACNFIGSYALEGEYLPHQSINIPEKLGQTERYLVSAAPNGDRQITCVPFDACIMTIPKFMALLGESGGLMVSTDDLFSVLLSITDRLRGRSTAEMRRVAA